MPTGSTALVLPVPEADPVVGPWRDRYDKHAAEGVPAHITLLSPFLSTDQVRARLGELRDILGNQPPRFSLNRLTRWRRDPGQRGLAVLEPDPSSWFHAVSLGLQQRTGLLPYGGRYGPAVLPHLTVAYGCDDPDEERRRFDEVEAAIGPSLPLTCVGSEAWFLEKVDQHWIVRHRLRFDTSRDQS